MQGNKPEKSKWEKLNNHFLLRFCVISMVIMTLLAVWKNVNRAVVKLSKFEFPWVTCWCIAEYDNFRVHGGW